MNERIEFLWKHLTEEIDKADLGGRAELVLTGIELLHLQRAWESDNREPSPELAEYRRRRLESLKAS